MDEKPILFPYRSWDHALKDEFKKIGGPDGAFKYMVKGYKTTVWRTRSNKRVAAREKAEDERGVR